MVFLLRDMMITIFDLLLRCRHYRLPYFARADFADVADTPCFADADDASMLMLPRLFS